MSLPLTTLVPLYTDPQLPGNMSKREAVRLIVAGRANGANRMLARGKPNRHARQRVWRQKSAEYEFEKAQDALWTESFTD